MNTGVSTVPCARVRRPRRAAPARAISENCIGSLTGPGVAPCRGSDSGRDRAVGLRMQRECGSEARLDRLAVECDGKRKGGAPVVEARTIGPAERDLRRVAGAYRDLASA